jgi:hypothetical protein
MLHAFFWYTGLAFWIVVSLGGLAFLAVDANDRHIRHRERNRSA